MKPMLLIVTAIVAFGSIVARADGIDTEHLFGFTIGTDIAELGEKELESNLLSRLGKRTGSYSALSQVLSLEYSANQNLRLEVSAVGAYLTSLASWDLMTDDGGVRWSVVRHQIPHT
jgi:hypothetical protein